MTDSFEDCYKRRLDGIPTPPSDLNETLQTNLSTMSTSNHGKRPFQDSHQDEYHRGPLKPYNETRYSGHGNYRYDYNNNNWGSSNGQSGGRESKENSSRW